MKIASLAPLALILAGCVTSPSQTASPAQLTQMASTVSAPAPAALPTFADSELAKLPGVQASMDKCREQGKKHKVSTRLVESGPMKGSLAIDVTCDQ